MRLEAIERPGLARSLGLPALAIGLTFLLGALLAMAAGANPFATFGLILKGAAGSKFALLETLNRATPLIFTGLAVAVAFRARLWNIGAEAQLYAGALVAVVVGTQAGLPGPVALALMALAAVLAGALLLLGPVLLKVRLGVDEVVTTLLLNFIMLLFVSMLLEGPLKDPMGMGWPKSPPSPATPACRGWWRGCGSIGASASRSSRRSGSGRSRPAPRSATRSAPSGSTPRPPASPARRSGS